MIRLNVYVKNYQDKFLNNLAKATGDTKSEHIRRAIDLYLKCGGRNEYGDTNKKRGGVPSERG